ncbi:Bifunctional inhibitor/lipid-transfer protein/seed storage 2S albumin superfamily protein [Trifolium repens]|nr:Bifunctional inhibitor/lipid-transfer protein/seed storage 2S albumin superfamily protein [Trifolium repens]
MKKHYSGHGMSQFFYAAAVVAIVLLGDHMAEALTCSPVEFSPCLGPITSSSPPTRTCCQKVREQRPCLCGYMKNPSLKQYVNSPGARRVSIACGVPFPTKNCN